MNPMTNMKNVKKLSEQELQRSFKTSWHDQYRDSAWIFVGGLPYDLTEGDVIAIFSQYGEIVNMNLVRDKDTGKQKGFCFICFEDQRSTVLAVDNFNGIKILGRTIRVDHVSDYKMPKSKKNADAETLKIQDEGCGPNVKLPKRAELPIPSTELPAFAKEEEAPPDGFKLPPRLPIGPVKIENETPGKKVKVKKEKKHKKNKKNKKKKSKKKQKKKVSSSESSSSSSSSSEDSTSDEESDKEDEKQKPKELKKINDNAENCSKKRSSEEPQKEHKKFKTYENKYDNKEKDNKKYQAETKGKEDDRKHYEDNSSRYFRSYDRKYEDRRFNERDDKYKRYNNTNDKRRQDDRRDRDSYRHRR